MFMIDLFMMTSLTQNIKSSNGKNLASDIIINSDLLDLNTWMLLGPSNIFSLNHVTISICYLKQIIFRSESVVHAHLKKKRLLRIQTTFATSLLQETLLQRK